LKEALLLEPLNLLEEIEKTNEEIRKAQRSRLELVEQFNGEIRSLIADFEDTPDKYRVFVDLVKRVNRIAQRIERARQNETLDYSERFDKALTILKKRKFETAKKELDRIPSLGMLAKQRSLFEEYKKAYGSLRAGCDELKEKISSMESSSELINKVDLSRADELAELKSKFKSYNMKVGDVLDGYFKVNPSRDSLKVGLNAGYIPELNFPKPFSRASAVKLYEFLINENLSFEPISTLLKYAKYSENKLSHYVSDTTTFRQVMESNIVWLESLDDLRNRAALKLSLEESSDSLLVRIPQIISFLSKISSSNDDVVTFLRTLRKLIISGHYERIKSLYELDAEQIEKLQSGKYLEDLKRLQDKYSDISKRLETLPDPRTVESQLA
jgi:hypothetical protein